MEVENQMNYKDQLIKCADKMQELAELLEPLFKAGHKNFAPNADWWSIIAGNRHCNLANIRMYRDFADQMTPEGIATDGNGVPFKLEPGDRWFADRAKQRAAAIAEREKDSPCQRGCLLSWEKQYAEKALNNPKQIILKNGSVCEILNECDRSKLKGVKSLN